MPSAPLAHVDYVLKYLSRYTHRVGISDSHLVDVNDESVTFRTKNGKTVTVTPVEFLHCFVQHALPDGFHKIRHYGLDAGTAEQALLSPLPRGAGTRSSTCPCHSALDERHR